MKYMLIYLFTIDILKISHRPELKSIELQFLVIVVHFLLPVLIKSYHRPLNNRCFPL